MIVYAGLGDFDRAFEWLHKSVDDLSLRLDALNPVLMQPLFEDLRADPRFRLFEARLGLGAQEDGSTP